MAFYLFSKAKRFTEGAPKFGFLGDGMDTLYPQETGYGQQRQFHVVNTLGASPAYSDHIAPRVTPTDGRFHSFMNGGTSPLINGRLYDVPDQGFSDTDYDN